MFSFLSSAQPHFSVWMQHTFFDFCTIETTCLLLPLGNSEHKFHICLAAGFLCAKTHFHLLWLGEHQGKSLCDLDRNVYKKKSPHCWSSPVSLGWIGLGCHKQIAQTGGFQPGKYVHFLIVMEAQKSKIKVGANSLLTNASLLGLRCPTSGCVLAWPLLCLYYSQYLSLSFENHWSFQI